MTKENSPWMRTSGGGTVANTKLCLEDVWDSAPCFLSWNINYPSHHSASPQSRPSVWKDHMMTTWAKTWSKSGIVAISVVMFASQHDSKRRVGPPDYEDPPPYSDGRYLMVTRRLMAVLTLVIMILFSLIVALLIKHSQQLELIKNNQDCLRQSLSVK